MAAEAERVDGLHGARIDVARTAGLDVHHRGNGR
jgi:hypothetical protein